MAALLTPEQAGYLRTLVLLGRQEQDRKDFILLSKHRSIRRLEDELAFISRNRIGAPGREITKIREELQAEWKEVNNRRYRLNGLKKKLTPVFEAQICVSRLENLPDLTQAELDELGRARAILTKSGMTAEQAREKRARLEADIYENGRRRKEARREKGEFSHER